MAARSPFFAVRLALLIVALIGVAGWAVRVQRTRSFRTDWRRPLVVSVVLVSERPVKEETATAWRAGLDSLETWMAGEAARYRDSAIPPVRFELARTAVTARLPALELPEGGFDRLRASWRLSKQLEQLDEGTGTATPRADAKIYVLLERTSPDELLRVEGIGASGGNVGAVRASAEDQDLTLTLTAVAHELFHCVGALDKYDEAGHARMPEGLGEPNRLPMFPQRFAEVMVGEVPLDAASGRLPTTLTEVRVGPMTAREIHWIH